jgi:hypothetical protein
MLGVLVYKFCLNAANVTRNISDDKVCFWIVDWIGINKHRVFFELETFEVDCKEVFIVMEENRYSSVPVLVNRQ